MNINIPALAVTAMTISAILSGCGRLPDQQPIASVPPAPAPVLKDILMDIGRSESGVLEVYAHDTPNGQPRLFLGTILPDRSRFGQWSLVVVQDAHNPAVRVICQDKGPPDGITEGCLLESLNSELDPEIAQRIYLGILRRLQNYRRQPPDELRT